MMGLYRHIAETDLLRLLDGEGSAAEHGRWRQHLAGCAQCRRRLGELEGLVAGVAAEINTIRPAPAPPRTWRATSFPSSPARRQQRGRAVPLLRAAAAVLLLALPILTVAPLRAWIVEHARGLLQPATAIAPETAAVEPVAEGAGEFRFVPATAVFHVRLNSLQASGTLVVAFGHDAPDAVLTYTNITSDDGVLLSEEHVRIENTPASTGSYHLLLPPGVRQVYVLLPQGGRHLLDADSAPVHAVNLRTAPGAVTTGS